MKPQILRPFIAFAISISCITPTIAAEMVIAPQFEAAGHFHEGVAPVRTDGVWGLIDREGEFVAAPTHQSIRPGHAGRFPVLVDGRWGLVRTDGTFAVPPTYEDLRVERRHGVFAAKQGGKWGYINPNGLIETGFAFEEIAARDGRFIAARDETGWFVYDPLGSPDTEYGDSRRLSNNPWASDDGPDPLDEIVALGDGLVVGRAGSRYLLYEIETQVEYEAPASLNAVLPEQQGDNPKFVPLERILGISQGLAPAMNGVGLWGFLGFNNLGSRIPYDSATTGWRIDPQFEAAKLFSEGFAAVRQGPDWGYVDKAGVVVLPPTYDAAYEFREGFALVRKGARRGFVSITDYGLAVAVEPTFEDAFAVREGLAPVKQGGLWGYLQLRTPTEATSARPIVDLIPSN